MRVMHARQRGGEPVITDAGKVGISSRGRSGDRPRPLWAPE